MAERSAMQIRPHAAHELVGYRIWSDDQASRTVGMCVLECYFDPEVLTPATRTELVCRSRQLRLRAAALPGEVIDIGYAEERRRFNENSAPRKSEMSVAALFCVRASWHAARKQNTPLARSLPRISPLLLSCAMIDDLFCYQRPFVVAAAAAALWERRVEWKEDRAVQLDAI